MTGEVGDPGRASRALRDQALRVRAEEIGLRPTEARPRVWGALMELGFANGVATLAVIADGSVSLYIDRGGGIIGAGAHANVREAAERFLDVVETHHDDFEAAGDTPLPSQGRVRFYIRTFDSTLAADADEQALGQGRHELSPVFHAGHAVITELRLVTERPEAP